MVGHGVILALLSSLVSISKPDDDPSHGLSHPYTKVGSVKQAPCQKGSCPTLDMHQAIHISKTIRGSLGCWHSSKSSVLQNYGQWNFTVREVVLNIPDWPVLICFLYLSPLDSRLFSLNEAELHDSGILHQGASRSLQGQSTEIVRDDCDLGREESL